MKNMKKWLSIIGGIGLAITSIGVTAPLVVSCSNHQSVPPGPSGGGNLGGSDNNDNIDIDIPNNSGNDGSNSGQHDSNNTVSPIPTLNQYCKYNPSNLIANIISKSQYDMMVNKTNDIAMDGKNLYTEYSEGTDKSGNWVKMWEYSNNQNINYVYVDNYENSNKENINIISYATSSYRTTKLENHGFNDIGFNIDFPIYNNVLMSAFNTYYVKEVTQADGSVTLQWYLCDNYYPENDYPENESQMNLNLNQQIDLYKTYVNNSSNWHATDQCILENRIISLLMKNKDFEIYNNKIDSWTDINGISWTETATWNSN